MSLKGAYLLISQCLPGHQLQLPSDTPRSKNSINISIKRCTSVWLRNPAFVPKNISDGGTGAESR